MKAVRRTAPFGCGSESGSVAIQFANSVRAMEALLKDVASGPDAPFYHYAPDAAALQQVFREVTNNLSELRLSSNK